jgi:hypothetical protein
MTRESLQETAGRIVSSDLLAAVAYLSFLSGAPAHSEAIQALERLKKHDYGGSDAGTAEWEADVRAAEGQLHVLIGLLPEEDVRSAGRMLEYLLRTGAGDRNAERDLRPQETAKRQELDAELGSLKSQVQGVMENRELPPLPDCIGSRGCSGTCHVCGAGEGELHLPRKFRGIFCGAHCPVCGGQELFEK